MTKTVPAGTVLSLHSQTEADELAHSLACQLAEADRICLEGIDGFACQNEFFQTIVIASSGPANDFVESSTWNIIGGALPPGLTLFPSFTDSFSAVIEGVPGSLGSFTFTVQVILDNGNVGQQTYTITVGGITTASPLNDALSATAYSAQLVATGLGSPLIWTVAGGNLPDGLLLDPATGVISGEAMQEGAFAFAVQADDGASQCVKAFSLTVTPGNTPCDLCTAENVNLGTIVPFDGPTSFGTFPAGDYAVTYKGGAFHDECNPDPFSGPPSHHVWKMNGHVLSWNSGANTQDWVSGVGCLNAGPSQAAVENSVKTTCFETFQFQHDGGTIGFNITKCPDPPNMFVAGSPNPTFQLTLVCKFPVMPNRVRINAYSAALFTVCAGEPASGNPAWDGTFPNTNFGPTSIYEWNANLPASFKGQNMIVAQVSYDQNSPGPTGCGWALEIFLSTKDSWLGRKLTGVTPVGVYTRVSGCSPGPATLTIESY